MLLDTCLIDDNKNNSECNAKVYKTIPNRPSKNSFSGIQFSELQGNLLNDAGEDRGRNHSS